MNIKKTLGFSQAEPVAVDSAAAPADEAVSVN